MNFATLKSVYGVHSFDEPDRRSCNPVGVSQTHGDLPPPPETNSMDRAIITPQPPMPGTLGTRCVLNGSPEPAPVEPQYAPTLAPMKERFHMYQEDDLVQPAAKPSARNSQWDDTQLKMLVAYVASGLFILAMVEATVRITVALVKRCK